MSRFTTATHIRELLTSSRASAACAKNWVTTDIDAALSAARNAATDAEEAVACIENRIRERADSVQVYAVRVGSRNYPQKILSRHSREELVQEVADLVHGRIRRTTIRAVAEAQMSIRDGEVPRGW